MIADLNVFRRYLVMLARDKRITVWHMALILGIMQVTGHDSETEIYISRRKIMDLSHISSIVTYHKCMKDLTSFGYIAYFPSYHPGIRSRVILLR